MSARRVTGPSGCESSVLTLFSVSTQLCSKELLVRYDCTEAERSFIPGFFFGKSVKIDAVSRAGLGYARKDRRLGCFNSHILSRQKVSHFWECSGAEVSGG